MICRRIVTARSQRLVLTFIATVSNYDYQFKWMFHQGKPELSCHEISTLKSKLTLCTFLSRCFYEGGNGSDRNRESKSSRDRCDSRRYFLLNISSGLMVL